MNDLLRPSRASLASIAVGVCLMLAAPAAPAGVVTIAPAKDNSLFSENGSLSNGAGQYLFAGKTLRNRTRRAVIAFDVAGGVPAGACISSVTLTLHMSRTISPELQVSLHRLLADWGAGTSDAGGREGTGAPATPGDATWTHAFFNTVSWAEAGGDFAGASATTPVNGRGFYTWGSTPAMIEDVQAWLADPATNFGWILIGDEGVVPSAKRFDSRENPDATVRPMLTVEVGTTFVVNSTDDAGDATAGDGTCETSAGVCTLRAAVQEANALPGGDCIDLPAGVYPLSIAGSDEDAASSGDLDITDDLTILAGQPGSTVIDAAGIADRVFHVLGSSTVGVSGLTIRNGHASGAGPAGWGGGILSHGTLTVTAGTITGNSASGLGGGVFNDGGTLALVATTVSGNDSQANRGGLYNLQPGTMTLRNSTVSGNEGYGIFNDGEAGLMLLNSTVAANSPLFGIHNSSASGSVELSNTIVGGNAMGSCSGEVSAIVSLGHNLDDGDTCGLSGDGDLIHADPRLAPLADNGGPTPTQALLRGSAAIDTGSPAAAGSAEGSCEAQDQRGVARPQDAACDIGAFEFLNRPPVADAGADAGAECSSPSGASVVLDGSGSSDPDSTPGTNDDIALFEWFLDFGLPSQSLLGTGETLGVTLPLGSHGITLRVTDGSGASDTDQVTVAVVDTTPPTITLDVTPDLLWPPNHRMTEVLAAVEAADLCSTPTLALSSISSSEPDDAPGGGDGRTLDDIQDAEVGSADFDFRLRAERLGSGDGRTYTVVYTATDGVGLSSSATALVTVPHDRGK